MRRERGKEGKRASVGLTPGVGWCYGCPGVHLGGVGEWQAGQSIFELEIRVRV
jgi:hypothetical protein